MKLGYACINRSIGCQANKTFRLASYSQEKSLETIENNLACLKKILEWNVKNNLLFFRISSEIIPFASHPVNTFDWQSHFKQELREIGVFIQEHAIRISMHPDQFVLINALKEDIVERSIADLTWHAQLLDALGLDATAKIQIHVGGVYGDRESAIQRFIANYKKLPGLITKRLAIENDDRLFSLADCLQVHAATNIPIIFDNFHHECLHNEEPMHEALQLAAKTWCERDGPLMIDYSSQQVGERKGKHATHIDESHFATFLQELQKSGITADCMLEIKDKEKSALLAKQVMHRDKLL